MDPLSAALADQLNQQSTKDAQQDSRLSALETNMTSLQGQVADLETRVSVLETPAPPPPPAGQILYQQTYVGQTGPNFGWDWGFYNGDSTVVPVSVVKDGLKPGTPSLKITMSTGSGSQHAEGLKKWPLTLGEDLYFGLAVKFNSPWGEPTPDGWGAAIFQGDYEEFDNSVWGGFVHADHMRFSLLSGKQWWDKPPTATTPGQGLHREYDNTDGAPQGPSPRMIQNLQPDTWYRIIVRVKAAFDPVGLAQVWVKGSQYTDWTKTVDLQNVPTLQWGTSNSMPPAPLTNTASGLTVSHKFGYYTGTRTVQRTFEHALPTIGTTLAVVQAAIS